MRNSLFLISLALSSAACAPAGDDTQQDAAPADTGPGASARAVASKGADGGAVAFEDNASKNGGNREFAYSWPAQVSGIEPLAAQLEAERDRELAAQKAEWEKSLEDFPEDCVSCISRGFEKEWKVVADLPGWLSLTADLYLYTGGAHGTNGRTSLVWDKSAQKGMAGVEMFKSPVALERALGPQLCDALDKEREKRRGMAVDREGGGTFDQCPGLDEASVFVGSSNGQSFDRIGVYFGPYVAGSYAEGDYELDFPVSASVLDAVKPEFASAFSVKR